MVQANMLEAKNSLSGLVRMVESGQEDCVVIARHGKPVAKIVRYDEAGTSRRVGAAKGKRLYADGWDSSEMDAEVAALFEAES